MTPRSTQPNQPQAPNYGGWVPPPNTSVPGGRGPHTGGIDPYVPQGPAVGGYGSAGPDGSGLHGMTGIGAGYGRGQMGGGYGVPGAPNPQGQGGGFAGGFRGMGGGQPRVIGDPATMGNPMLAQILRRGL